MERKSNIQVKTDTRRTELPQSDFQESGSGIHPMAIGCKLGRAYQIMIGQLGVTLREHGLDITPAEYLILRAVYCAPGLQQCDIAEMVGKDKASVCRGVAALEKKGLVRTEAVSHKCLRVYPSDRGNEIYPTVMSVAEERYNALAALTSPADLAVFSSILDRIIGE